MANQPSKSWGGAEDNLAEGISHWAVSDYDIAEIVAALIGAFWGIKAGVV